MKGGQVDGVQRTEGATGIQAAPPQQSLTTRFQFQRLFVDLEGAVDKDILKGGSLEFGVAIKAVIAERFTADKFIGEVAVRDILLFLHIVVPALGTHKQAIILVLQVDVAHCLGNGRHHFATIIVQVAVVGDGGTGGAAGGITGKQVFLAGRLHTGNSAHGGFQVPFDADVFIELFFASHGRGCGCQQAQSQGTAAANSDRFASHYFALPLPSDEPGRNSVCCCERCCSALVVTPGPIGR